HAPDIFRFTVLASLLSPMLSATIGMASLTMGGLAHGVDSGVLWCTWWLGDAMGILLVTPFVLSWSGPRPWSWRRTVRLEPVLVCLTVDGGGPLLFSALLPGAVQNPPALLAFPPLAWMAFRLPQRAVTTTAAVLAILATWGTVQGFGPLAQEGPNAAILLLHTFMG